MHNDPDTHNGGKNKIVYPFNFIPISLDFFKTFISPSLAALCDRLFFHPIENIITTQQMLKLDFFKAIKVIYNEKGIKQFYRGIAWPLLFAIPDRLTMYGSYFFIRDHLKKKEYFNSDNTTKLVSGVLSGVVDAIAACPPESQRIRANCNISQPSVSFNTLYRGFTPMLFKTVVGSTVTIAGADYILEKMPRDLKEKHYTPFAAGLFSGMATQLLVTPADVLKTRLMSDYSNKKISAHLAELWQLKMLYMGLMGRMVRIGVGSSLMIGFINYFNYHLEQYCGVQSQLEKNQIDKCSEKKC